MTSVPPVTRVLPVTTSGVATEAPISTPTTTAPPTSSDEQVHSRAVQGAPSSPTPAPPDLSTKLPETGADSTSALRLGGWAMLIGSSLVLLGWRRCRVKVGRTT